MKGATVLLMLIMGLSVLLWSLVEAEQDIPSDAVLEAVRLLQDIRDTSRFSSPRGTSNADKNSEVKPDLTFVPKNENKEVDASRNQDRGTRRHSPSPWRRKTSPSPTPKSKLRIVGIRVDASSNSVPMEKLVGADTSRNINGHDPAPDESREYVSIVTPPNIERLSQTFKTGRNGRARVVKMRRLLPEANAQKDNEEEKPASRAAPIHETTSFDLLNPDPFADFGKRINTDNKISATESSRFDYDTDNIENISNIASVNRIVQQATQANLLTSKIPETVTPQSVEKQTLSNFSRLTKSPTTVSRTTAASVSVRKRVKLPSRSRSSLLPNRQTLSTLGPRITTRRPTSSFHTSSIGTRITTLKPSVPAKNRKNTNQLIDIPRLQTKSATSNLDEPSFHFEPPPPLSDNQAGGSSGLLQPMPTKPIPPTTLVPKALTTISSNFLRRRPITPATSVSSAFTTHGITSRPPFITSRHPFSSIKKVTSTPLISPKDQTSEALSVVPKSPGAPFRAPITFLHPVPHTTTPTRQPHLPSLKTRLKLVKDSSSSKRPSIGSNVSFDFSRVPFQNANPTTPVVPGITSKHPFVSKTRGSTLQSLVTHPQTIVFDRINPTTKSVISSPRLKFSSLKPRVTTPLPAISSHVPFVTTFQPLFTETGTAFSSSRLTDPSQRPIVTSPIPFLTSQRPVVTTFNTNTGSLRPLVTRPVQKPFITSQPPDILKSNQFRLNSQASHPEINSSPRPTLSSTTASLFNSPQENIEKNFSPSPLSSSTHSGFTPSSLATIGLFTSPVPGFGSKRPLVTRPMTIRPHQHHSTSGFAPTQTSFQQSKPFITTFRPKFVFSTTPRPQPIPSLLPIDTLKPVSHNNPFLESFRHPDINKISKPNNVDLPALPVSSPNIFQILQQQSQDLPESLTTKTAIRPVKFTSRPIAVTTRPSSPRPHVVTSRPNVVTSRPNVVTLRPNVIPSTPNGAISRPNEIIARPVTVTSRPRPVTVTSRPRPRPGTRPRPRPGTTKAPFFQFFSLGGKPIVTSSPETISTHITTARVPSRPAPIHSTPALNSISSPTPQSDGRLPTELTPISSFTINDKTNEFRISPLSSGRPSHERFPFNSIKNVLSPIPVTPPSVTTPLSPFFAAFSHSAANEGTAKPQQTNVQNTRFSRPRIQKGSFVPIPDPFADSRRITTPRPTFSSSPPIPNPFTNSRRITTPRPTFSLSPPIPNPFTNSRRITTPRPTFSASPSPILTSTSRLPLLPQNSSPFVKPPISSTSAPIATTARGPFIFDRTKFRLTTTREPFVFRHSTTRRSISAENGFSNGWQVTSLRPILREPSTIPPLITPTPKDIPQLANPTFNTLGETFTKQQPTNSRTRTNNLLNEATTDNPFRKNNVSTRRPTAFTSLAAVTSFESSREATADSSVGRPQQGKTTTAKLQTTRKLITTKQPLHPLTASTQKLVTKRPVTVLPATIVTDIQKQVTTPKSFFKESNKRIRSTRKPMLLPLTSPPNENQPQDQARTQQNLKSVTLPRKHSSSDDLTKSISPRPTKSPTTSQRKSPIPKKSGSTSKSRSKTKLPSSVFRSNENIKGKSFIFVRSGGHQYSIVWM